MRRSIAYRDGTLDPGLPADPEPACLRVLQDRGWVPLGWLRTTQRERPRTPPTRPLDARDRVWRSPDRTVCAQVLPHRGVPGVDLWSVSASGAIVCTRWRDSAAAPHPQALNPADAALRLHAGVEEATASGTLADAVEHHLQICSRRAPRDGSPLELDVAGLAAVQTRRDDLLRALGEGARREAIDRAYLFWGVSFSTTVALLFALVLLLHAFGASAAHVALGSSASAGFVVGMMATATSGHWMGWRRGLVLLALFSWVAWCRPGAVVMVMLAPSTWAACAGAGLGCVAGWVGERVHATWWPIPIGTIPGWLPLRMAGAEVLARYGPRLDGQLGCGTRLSPATATTLDGALAEHGFRALGERWVEEPPLHKAAAHWSEPPMPRTLPVRVWASPDGLTAAEPAPAGDGSTSLVLRSHTRKGMIHETRTLPDPGPLEQRVVRLATGAPAPPPERIDVPLDRSGWWPSAAALRLADRPHAGLSVASAPDPAAALVAHRAWLATREGAPMDTLEDIAAAAHRVAASRSDPPTTGWRIRHHLMMVGLPTAFVVGAALSAGWDVSFPDFLPILMLLQAVAVLGEQDPAHPTDKQPWQNPAAIYWLPMIVGPLWLFEPPLPPLALSVSVSLGLAIASARYSVAKDQAWSRSAAAGIGV